MAYLGEVGLSNFKEPKKKLTKIQKANAKKRKVKNSVKADKSEDTLWKWFSRYIRLRACLDVARGFCACITCGRVHHYKDMDAGHYISRRWKPTKYHENNVYAQCVHCNRDLSGNVAEYRIKLVELFGEEHVAEMEAYSRTPFKKMLHEDVVALAAYYRIKAKEEADRLGVEIK
jgi:hypothetical protein